MSKIEISRNSGRTPTEIRETKIHRNYVIHPDGSCLIAVGNTKVICTASIEEQVPIFLRGKGKGWITSEYGMLPRSTPSRMARESAKGKMGGRTQEIQRLIGRSLRAVVDLKLVGERTIWIDCDVIQADGGTRTAAITGSAVALFDAFDKLVKAKKLERSPMKGLVAAVSVGIVRNFPLLDLDYNEDSNADVDMNVVMTETGKFIEIQGTAEGYPFSRSDLNSLLDMAKQGIKELITIQRDALKPDNS